MSAPKSLVLALYSHWEIVEHLTLLSREFPAFEPEQVLAVIARGDPAKDPAAREETLRKLAASDLLQPLPRGTSLQLHPLVLEFVRGLTREHELGLAAVLRARVEAIREATGGLMDGLAKREMDPLRRSAAKLSELFRQIGQQLDQDRHAILELAERAKSADANLPIARRYAEVLSAYDDYIEPMAEMMDSGPSGTFYRHLETAEHALDHAVESLTIQGALYTQRLALRQVAFQAKELRRLGREVLKQCSDTLLPLREEIRQHNTLSAAVSQLLGQVRKRGLNRVLGCADLPLWRRDTPRRVAVGGAVLGIMGEALHYQPARLQFPEESHQAEQVELDLIDEQALLQALRAELPVADLLGWLHARYGNLSDGALLRVYQNLLEREEWQAIAAELPVRQALNRVRVTHYPHAIQNAAVPPG